MKKISKYCLTLGLATICAASVFSAAAFELPGKVCFNVVNPGITYGGPSYFDATLLLPQGEKKFDCWCVQADVQIVYGPIYTAEVLTPAQAAAQGLVQYPANFDLVAYIVNQDYPGKPSPSGGVYTFGDVQMAIWTLIDDSTSIDLGPWDPIRVAEIVAAAMANGEGFVPTCGQRNIVVLKPVAEGCQPDTTQTAPITQVLIIEIPVPCGPGTGTPGYWSQPRCVWPVSEITIGGITYSKAEAVAGIKLAIKGDKRWTLFAALVCAKLNVLIGNEDSCVKEAISLADAWWAMYNAAPVRANSDAWSQAEPLYWCLDAYNNGELCAPSRDSSCIGSMTPAPAAAVAPSTATEAL